MKEWFSIQELLGISGLPNSDRGIMKNDLHPKIWIPNLRCRLCLTLINFV